MKYFLTFLLLCSAATSFADRWPSNRGYGDLFFREPPGPPQEQRRSDRETTIYSYPDYYYGNPGYNYYPSYPSSGPGYDPFPDATRARSIFDENVKR